MSDEHPDPSGGAAPERPERLPLRERIRRSIRKDEEGRSPLGRKLLLVGAGLAAVCLVVVAALWFNCGVRGCPDVALLKGYQPDEASVVLDRDGEEVTKLFRVKRTVVPVDSLPEHVPQAFVAIEDQRFYEHEGVDWRRMFGAGWETAKSVLGGGGGLEGGSTITMQMAGNLFPERLDRREQTVWRKIGELRVAGQIENHYSKEEILELYVNQIYFGSSAWGIEAAAQEYFGKSASDLTLEEAALLAGLPQAPSRLSPRNDIEASKERRNVVLSRMADQGMITPEEAAQAKDSDIQLARSTKDEDLEVAAYFVEHLRRQLEDELGQTLYTDGYVIHTTLDLDAQRILETELERQLRNVERGVYGAFPHPTYEAEDAAESGSDYLQGAAVIMDATSGDVLALVGGRDFEQSKYNRATQAARQPGSAFKPFVYATAIERGYPLTHPLEDTPLRLVMDEGRQVWEPKNYGGSYAGRISMREALVQSKNTATVRLAQAVGVQEVLQTARQAGVRGELPNFPSVVLGSGQVTLLNLTSAYTTFATLGEQVEPRFVTRVEDRDGRAVWTAPIERHRAMDPGVAFLVTDVLQDVVNRGTATAVRAVGYRGPVAGKTGTTNEGTDVWFIGYTPQVVGGVWIGFDEPKSITSGATGGGFAAPVWGRVMRQLGLSSEGWSPPPGVQQRMVDARGNVVGENCPTGDGTRQEWFLGGSASTGDCYRGYYAWGDSMLADSARWDDMGGELDLDSLRAADESWWRRMRERLAGDREPQDSVQRERDRERAERMDSLPRVPVDSVRQPRDTLLGRPVRPDTVRRDTARRAPPPPDTASAGASSPDTSGAAPPAAPAAGGADGASPSRPAASPPKR